MRPYCRHATALAAHLASSRHGYIALATRTRLYPMHLQGSSSGTQGMHAFSPLPDSHLALGLS